MTKRIEVNRAVRATSSPAIIAPPPAAPRVRVLTRADVIISTALEVVAHEIDLRSQAIQANPATPMNAMEAETFGRHVKALATLRALDRDERENPLANLSDEQLQALARAALKELEGK